MKLFKIWFFLVFFSTLVSPVLPRHAFGATAASCSACSGSGVCWVCHGSGHRLSGEACGVCHGTGKCWYCSGKGRVAARHRG